MTIKSNRSCIFSIKSRANVIGQTNIRFSTL